MLTLISPAKSLDFSEMDIREYSQPRLMEEGEKLVKVLKKKSKKDLKKLMSISDNLAQLNYERYQQFETPFSPENAKPAIYTFTGDVYTGLDVEQLDAEDVYWSQNHLRILSGLYGVLRPLDLMQPYRLEMGTSLKVSRNKNLYDFWGTKITELLNEDLAASGTDHIINLASKEYFKAVKKKKLNGTVWDIKFRENRGGEWKFISFNAKKARGMMCRYIIQNRVNEPEGLKGFDLDGYVFNDDLSEEKNWVFTKG